MMANDSRRHSSDPPQLPYDVYSVIVDEVATDWTLRPFLTDLSLAQKLLVPLCQQHLFKRLDYGTRNIERLTFLTNVSPHLIGYIRRFHYTFSGNDSIVVEFIQKLRGVNSFWFCADSDDRLVFRDFRTLDPALIMAIHGILISPDLRWLSLKNIENFPVESLLRLGNAPNLRFLEIRGVSIGDVPEPLIIPDSNAPSAPLSELCIHPSSSEVVTFILGEPASEADNPPVFNFPSVRALEVEGESDLDVEANKILIVACNRVEMLTCTLEEEAHMDFEGFADSILLGPAQTLRSLHFNRPIPWITPEDHFCGIVEELKLLSDSRKLNALEALQITLGIYNTEPTPDEAEGICDDMETWAAELDAIFGEDCGFPSIRTVVLWVTVACVPHREYKYNKKIRTQVNKIYKATASKIKEQGFDNLYDLGFEFKMHHEWDLTDWDRGR